MSMTEAMRRMRKYIQEHTWPGSRLMYLLKLCFTLYSTVFQMFKRVRNSKCNGNDYSPSPNSLLSLCVQRIDIIYSLLCLDPGCEAAGPQCEHAKQQTDVIIILRIIHLLYDLCWRL